MNKLALPKTGSYYPSVDRETVAHVIKVYKTIQDNTIVHYRTYEGEDRSPLHDFWRLFREPWESKESKRINSTKRRITVYNEGRDRPIFPGLPFKVEVDAWCVGGEEGIIAFFFHGRYLCEAHGDDGHWWLSGYMDMYWTKAFKNAVAEIPIPKD